MRLTKSYIVGLTAWCWVTASAAEQKVSPQAIEFFEKNVRPVLVEKCAMCHGATLQQSQLRVDSREALLKGGARGAAIVPGKPEQSWLIKAITHADEKIKMPPTGKLSHEEIENLTAWVEMGAPWTAKVTSDQLSVTRRKHWAFEPVKRPQVPRLKNKHLQGRVKTPIDAFVLAQLEQKGLKPAPWADRRTLIRRAYFDLIGLPPTFEEVEAFIHDKSPNAWEKVVDRLLASPRFGERWARRWMDVARYADNKGYVFNEDRNYPYAYTYRDWLIRAFNEDLPYDQFLMYQIAADHLAPEDKQHLAAMGFLTLGRRFLNNIHDIIDDRIDVVTRGTMGLTVTCARCHDHKYDPISMKDYYALYGVFASSIEPKDLPLIEEPKKTEAYLAFERELQAREAEVIKFREAKRAEYLTNLRKPETIAAYLLFVRDARGLSAEQAMDLARKRDLNPLMARRWRTFLDETAKSHHPIFAPWHAFAALSEQEFAARAAGLAEKFAANADPQKPLNGLVAQAFAQPPASLPEVAARYGALLSRFQQPHELPNADEEALRQALNAIGAPLDVPPNETEQLFNRADRDQLRALQRKVDEWKASNPAAPARAMVLVDAPTPVTPRVFLRGNPNTPGEEVPRQFLAVLSGDNRQPFTKGSGRLELAQAIASKDNPLTTRVFVNRVWQHLFGKGLVNTPSDFGARCEPPTHPELLDWLAYQFMSASVQEVREPMNPMNSFGCGWSVKKLLRLILLSSTYQQSSLNPHPSTLTKDPDNALLSRMNRRRLDFEAMRDALLWASGQLDLTMGGKSEDITKPPFSKRRTIYGYIDRQNLPNLFRTFDFASPDTHAPQRFTTTVPQQALFLMNSPFVIEQVRALMRRPEIAEVADSTQRIQVLYRLLYQRDATPDEVALGLRFLESAEPEEGTQKTADVIESKAESQAAKPLTAWEKYAQVLLLANEFVFVD
ncbi:MAG: PSD1 and planctomycete cytochrome C domain-containing protein [Abditibacteriales bacterium]|nr:PSD1 and planctomycete cytochrome C domain-containing protein [Abditibacteriales bacterium]